MNLQRRTPAGAIDPLAVAPIKQERLATLGKLKRYRRTRP